MNLHYSLTPSPLKVLVVNPLAPASQLTIVKILSGKIFGKKQIIDLILLVYTNEIGLIEAFKLELMSCAFPCMRSIEISSTIPSVSDADVFCFITNFPNPNCIDFSNTVSTEHFDTFYLIIKIAHNFSMPQFTAQQPFQANVIFNEKNIIAEQKPRKPIFIADGIVTMDILMYFSTNVPNDLFFCSTPLTSISKSVIADYLKVTTNVINNILVWAANDQVFHVEVEKPSLIYDKLDDRSLCDSDLIAKDILHLNKLDYTQYNDSWMKKEFIEKIMKVSSKNPYGCIYKAAEISKTLESIWVTRSSDDESKFYCSIGVISDGSLGTLKGYPYVLPIVFSGESWNVNKHFAEDTHIQLEIKRINKAVKEHHQKLIQYCKKFYEENVINQTFVGDDESPVSSVVEASVRSNV